MDILVLREMLYKELICMVKKGKKMVLIESDIVDRIKDYKGVIYKRDLKGKKKTLGKIINETLDRYLKNVGF